MSERENENTKGVVSTSPRSTSKWKETAERLRKELIELCLGSDLPDEKIKWEIVSSDDYGDDEIIVYRTDLQVLFFPAPETQKEAEDTKFKWLNGYIVLENLINAMISDIPMPFRNLRKPLTRWTRSEKLTLVEFVHAIDVLRLDWSCMKSFFSSGAPAPPESVSNNYLRVPVRGKLLLSDRVAHLLDNYSSSNLITEARSLFKAEFMAQFDRSVLLVDSNGDYLHEPNEDDDNSPPYFSSGTGEECLIQRCRLRLSGTLAGTFLHTWRHFATTEELQDAVFLYALRAGEVNGKTDYYDWVPADKLIRLVRERGHTLIRSFRQEACRKPAASSSLDDEILQRLIHNYIPFAHEQPVPLGLLIYKLRGIESLHQSLPESVRRDMVSDLAHNLLMKLGFRRLLDVLRDQWPSGTLATEKGFDLFKVWKGLLDAKNSATLEGLEKRKRNQWESIVHGHRPINDDLPRVPGGRLYPVLRHYASVERYLLRVTFMQGASATESPHGTLIGVPFEVREHIMTYILGSFSLPKNFLREKFVFLGRK